MPHVFVTSCINANGDDINEMMQMPLCQALSTSNFINRIAPKLGIDQHIIESLGYDSKRQFADDWALGCYKSYYQGLPCYLVQHSRIEYVYVDSKDYAKVLDAQGAAARQIRLQVLADDLDELMHEHKPASPKQTYALIKTFHLEHREDLARNRVPLSSLAQYQCEHRQAALSFDRKHYGVNKNADSEPTL